MNVYTFRFTKSLANYLIKLADRTIPGSVFNTAELLKAGIISTSDYTNTSHLKYIGLIEKPKTGQGVEVKAALWRITILGAKLLAGKSTVPAWVKVYDNKVIEVAPGAEWITLAQASGYYQDRRIWRESVERAERSTESQGTLF